MERFAPCRRLLLLALCVLAGCMGNRAFAEAPVDITVQCLPYVWSNQYLEKNLFDSNPKSAWSSAPKHEGSHFFQIYKPFGEATINVMWAEAFTDLRLQRMQDGAFADLQSFPPLSAEKNESFYLPEVAGLYRLTSSKPISIAEIRVHAGRVPNFFTGAGYPSGLTKDYPKEELERPAQRRVNTPDTPAMQTRLKELGYFQGTCNGRFEMDSYMAVVRFQRANGVYVNGTLDKPTQARLYAEDAVRGSLVPDAPPALMQRTASTVVAYVRSKVGMGYVYGAGGQVCSPDVRAVQARQYTEHAELIRDFCRQWDGLEVFDCVGLFKSFLANSEGEYPELWHTNVNGAVQRWMVETGPIETMPREPGILLLQENAAKPGSFIHMGMYVGDGQCVHARGHRYGVVQEPMPQLWTHWARPVWLTFDIPVEEPAKEWVVYMPVGSRVLVDTATGNALNLYKYPIENRNNLLNGLRIPNHTELTITEVPAGYGSHFWRKVSWPDSAGVLHTGYVFAKDLTPLYPIFPPMQLRLPVLP